MGIANYAATRLKVSIGFAVLVVVATVVPASTASALDVTPPDKTALIMGGTSVPTWNDSDVEVIMDQFIAPSHPGQTIEPVAVTTPEEGWPITGLIRLLGLALGPPSIFGPGGAAWPNEPWWKLSGLFDLSYEPSIQAGVADLETAMAGHGNDHLVIYGYSQGAMIAIREKRKLAEQYPAETDAPDIDFVLSEDPNLPNGGLLARFPGLYIPILDLAFNGAEPTDTQFDTAVITRQYDGLADFPLYPLDVVSDLNAVLGIFYVHLYPFDASLAPDPSTSPSIRSQHGDTSYYFFPTQDLPLFAPLRSLGVPESVIDVVQPFFRVLVELGYDRTIPQWKPTSARLIPQLDPAKVVTDLVDAIGTGINNALALVGSPAPPSSPAPARVEAPRPVDALPNIADAGISANVDASETAAQPILSESTTRATADSSATRGPVAAKISAASIGSSAVSTSPAAQVNPEASTITADNAAKPSVKPQLELSASNVTLKAPKPMCKGMTHALVGQPTRRADVPRSVQLTTGTMASEGAPKPEPNLNASSSADSSSTPSSADSSSPGGAGSE